MVSRCCIRSFNLDPGFPDFASLTGSASVTEVSMPADSSRSGGLTSRPSPSLPPSCPRLSLSREPPTSRPARGQVMANAIEQAILLELLPTITKIRYAERACTRSFHATRARC